MPPCASMEPSAVPRKRWTVADGRGAGVLPAKRRRDGGATLRTQLVDTKLEKKL
jgi:hypothetical protein